MIKELKKEDRKIANKLKPQLRLRGEWKYSSMRKTSIVRKNCTY
jgi:hypothetical protein